MQDVDRADPDVGEPRHEVVDLSRLGERLLDSARDGRGPGRAAHSLVAGPGRPLKQVLMALDAGSRLADHRAPGAASLLVLSGRVTLTWDDRSVVLDRGQWAPIPAAVHGLHAAEPTVVLLTVAAAATDPA
jgi:quercetin dioxygenase-like cupin family protein